MKKLFLYFLVTVCSLVIFYPMAMFYVFEKSTDFDVVRYAVTKPRGDGFGTPNYLARLYIRFRDREYNKYTDIGHPMLDMILSASLLASETNDKKFEKKIIETGQVLINRGQDVNSYYPNGLASVHVGIMLGVCPFVRLLIDNGADLSLKITGNIKYSGMDAYELLENYGLKEKNITAYNCISNLIKIKGAESQEVKGAEHLKK